MLEDFDPLKLGEVYCNEHGSCMLQKHMVETLSGSVLFWGVMHCEVSYSAA